MKNPLHSRLINWFPAVLVLSYIGGLFVGSGPTVLFTGLFIMIMVIFSQREWTPRQLLWLLSPFLTYPLLLFVLAKATMGARGPYVEWVWYGAFLLYSGFYVYKLRWLKSSRSLMGGLTALTLVAFMTGKFALFCGWVSASEKGILESQVELCRAFDLYHPVINPKGWLVVMVVSGLGGPLLISLGLIGLLIWKSKKVSARRVRNL